MIVRKRIDATRKQTAVRYCFIVAAALATGAFVILAAGYDPVAVSAEILRGSLGTPYRISETVRTATPILIMALGAAVCFKVKFINIGTEGQFYVGALFATYFALNFGDAPRGALLSVMFAASVVGGGLWCAVPAVLKEKLGVNETLVTLMLNYVAIKFIAYLQYGPWKDPKIIGFPVIPQFTENAILPKLFGVHIGWLIALVLLAFVTVLLYRTRLGYKITVLGENPNTARYAGYRVLRLTVTAAFIGGGLCGVAGFIQASAVENSLNALFSNGWGFTAIVVAWMGKLRPLPILGFTLFIAVLIQGCAYLQISMGVPYFMANVIQAIILFFILGGDFFTNRQIILRQGKEERAS
jgi:simple sugar transport system permease protein